MNWIQIVRNQLSPQKKGPQQSWGIFVLLVALGAILIYLPSWVADIVREGNEMGPVGRWIYFSIVGVGILLIGGTVGWLVWKLVAAKFKKDRRRAMRDKSPGQLSVDQRRTELRENLSSVSDFRDDLSESDFREQLDPMVDRIEFKLHEGTLEIIAFGTISSGKSSLLNALAGEEKFSTNIVGGTTVKRNEIAWPGNNKVQLVDTPGLGEVDGQVHQEIATHSAQDADLILLVVDGPLRDSEHKLLELLSQMDKRVLVCLNKEDWFTDTDKAKLLQQITQQTSEMVQAENILSVRSRATQRKRIRVLPDGEEVEEEVEVPLSIEPLARRMMQIVKKDGTDLLLANLLMQSRGLVDRARQEVEVAIDRRADQVVNRYMWASGGATALASPLPIVDLAVGVGISTKMVIDLASVYRQDVDLDVAVGLLGQLGKQLIGFLGVQLVVPALMASLLKSVPIAGQLAGGVLQGVVIALITRWIGNVFMVYFKEGMQAPEGGMAGLAKREWRKVTDANYLRNLVHEARQRYVDRK